jgi:sugar phosphate isomerase/epimerase
MKIGLQIYSVRNQVQADFVGTMEQVASHGYAGVELYSGIPGTAEETKALLNRLNLEAVSHHFILEELEKDLEACIARAKTLEIDHIVCAWSKPTPEQSWEDIVVSVGKIAKAIEAKGMTFSYHNHDHEIKEYVHGKRVFDALMDVCDLEVDIAWLHTGGVSAPEYLAHYAPRTKLIHFKDVKKSGDKFDTVELGQGEVPLQACLEVAPQTKSAWLMVEQDESPDPLESAKRNYQWLKAALQ